MGIGRFWRAAGDVLLPRVCIVCGKKLNLDERHICLGCLADIPLTRFWDRGHNPMADRFNEKIQERKTGVQDEVYAYATALFFYHSEAGYRHIPYQIKYHGNISAGRYFGRMLGRRMACEGGVTEPDREGGPGQREDLWSDIDMVIPVPLHWTRRWRRGYNQAEVIAGAIAEAIGVPVRNDVLVRRRRTKTQVKLGIEEKGKNVDGAFEVTGKFTSLERDAIRHILIVDDVFTTGSTLTACFDALRSVFPPAVRISVATLGYLER